jgi:hypothetical protein
VRIEPRVLLGDADEMAGLAGEREAESGLAILAAHAAQGRRANRLVRAPNWKIPRNSVHRQKGTPPS